MKNERADTKAKFGATRQQTDIPTSYAAARTAIAETGRERWLRRWAASSKSWVFYDYKQAPSGRDPWHKLNRQDQSTIFRWRTGHAEINSHLNRIKKKWTPFFTRAWSHDQNNKNRYLTSLYNDILVYFFVERPTCFELVQSDAGFLGEFPIFFSKTWGAKGHFEGWGRNSRSWFYNTKIKC